MFYLQILTVLSGTLVILIKANNELECQPGWYFHNDQCYWFSNFTTTRDSAKIACTSLESVLVTIESSNTNTILKQQIHDDTSYWIGLSIHNIAQSVWRQSDGQPLKHVSKLTIEWCDSATPDTACAVIIYGQTCITNAACTTKLPFMCVKDTSACPQNWKSHSDGTIRCYYIGSEKKSRTDASKFCWKYGGRLVSIPSYLVKEYIVQNRPTTENKHWIGLSPYKWDSGVAYNWDNWGNEGPDVTKECTRLLRTGMWTYGDCSVDTHNFICQKVAELPPTTTASSTTALKPTTTDSDSTSASTRSIENTVTDDSRQSTDSTKSTTIRQNIINTSKLYTASHITTMKGTESTGLGYAETTTKIYNEDDRPIIVYVLIGVYTLVGVTAIVFIGLLVKYISLRRRYEKLNNEQPSEIEMDDNDMEDDVDHKLYDYPDYVSVDHQETISSDIKTVSHIAETEHVVYSEIGADSSKARDTETKQIHDVTATHESNKTNIQSDPEPSGQESDGNLYHNDPHCMNNLTNSQDENIYEDAINVNITEPLNTDK